MEFRRVLALRGPNIWANYPVLEAWVALGELDRPSTDFPGMAERIMAWLPSMIEHRCSVGERGGFFQRLREGTYPAHILEHVCIELQNLAGSTVGYGRARETAEEGVYRVVVRYRDERLARACLLAARELVLAAIHDSPYDVAQEVSKLRELADRVCLGPSTAAIVAAADARGIPVRRLNEGSLVQLGQGAKQRRIWTAETDRTSAVAESIAQDKELTKSLLRAGGIPVPEGRLVSDADDAWQAAEEIDRRWGIDLIETPNNVPEAMHGLMAARAGKIVNISSVTFFLGVGNLAHYTASKGGVIGLTRSLARAAGPYNVHVNCVTPGFIQTESEVRFVNEDEARQMVADQCLARRISPLDVARVCLFLACELSDGMTGQCLNVDGGWVMH